MLRFSVFALLLLVSGCKHWKVTQEAQVNPLAGQSRVVVLPLGWEGVQIDGDPESVWLAGQDADGKKGWPADKAEGGDEFKRGLSEALAGGKPALADPANPQGAVITLKPVVKELATGGRRPTIVNINVQVVDATGATVEEITTTGEWKNMFIGLNSRLKAAAEIAGRNVAEYLQKRTGG